MALIAANTARGKSAEFEVLKTALTGTDTLAYNPSLVQVLYLQNTDVTPQVVTIDGDAVTTVSLPGQGKPINNAAGYAISVPAGAILAVTLASIRNFLAGVVNVTGGDALMSAWIIEG